MGYKLMLNNKCIVVLGMHRSGTSALTAVLSMLGAYPGDSLIPAKESINPKGFWEHADIVAVHDELLKAIDSAWYDERIFPDDWWLMPSVAPYYAKLKEITLRDFCQTPLWILKDPRCCRLLPVWLSIFKEINCTPYFVIMLRDPSEVVSSLTDCVGFHNDKSYLLWLRYVLDSEIWSRGYPRAVVTYEQLLCNWRSTTDLIARRFSLEWPIDQQSVEPIIQEFLDSSLRHHVGNNNYLSKNILAIIAHQLYGELISLPENESSSEVQGVMEIDGSVAELQKLLSPLLESLNELTKENLYLHSEVQRVKSTASWQITKPLRAIGNVKKLFKT